MSPKIKHIKNITSTEREKYPGILHNWDQVWFLTQENVKHEKGVIVAYEKFGKRVYFDDFYKDPSKKTTTSLVS